MFDCVMKPVFGAAPQIYWTPWLKFGNSWRRAKERLFRFFSKTIWKIPQFWSECSIKQEFLLSSLIRRTGETDSLIGPRWRKWGDWADWLFSTTTVSRDSLTLSTTCGITWERTVMEAMAKLERYNYTLYGNEATFFLLALKFRYQHFCSLWTRRQDHWPKERLLNQKFPGYIPTPTNGLWLKNCWFTFMSYLFELYMSYLHSYRRRVRVILLAVKRQDLYWSVITTIMPRTGKFRNRLAQQKVSANQANSIEYFRSSCP